MKEYLVHVRYCSQLGHMDDYVTKIKTDDIAKVHEIAFNEVCEKRWAESVSFSRVIEEIK